MKRILSIVLFYSLVALLLPGCNKNTVDIEQFKNMNFPGLIVKGRVITAFDDNNWQAAYYPSRAEFGLFDDNFSNFVLIKCSAVPTKGANLKADVRYTTVDNIKHLKNVHFEVLNVDANSSLVWLYSSKDDVCAIVKMVR